MKRLKAIVYSLGFIILASCQQSEEQLVITSRQELETAVDSLFSNHINPDDPGAAVLVAYDGEMLIGKGYGLSNYSGQVPVKPTTNFRMASTSKQFTALCILRLFDLKLLYPNQDVGRILKAEPLRGIEVQHLLYHTSGLPEYDPVFNNWNKPEVPQNEDVLNWYRDNGTPEFEPGTQFKYSNGGYNLLATIVEEVTGVKFEQFAREQIFLKNGMLTSIYYNLGYPVEIVNRAYCYENKDGVWSQVDGNLLNGLVGEVAAYTNVRDYFQFDRQIRLGRVLDGDAINLIFTPDEIELDDFSDQLNFLKPGNARYAAGWYVQGDVAFHGGLWYGTSTMVVHNLSKPLTIAVFRNTNEPVNQLINGLHAIADSYVNFLEQEGKYGN